MLVGVLPTLLLAASLWLGRHEPGALGLTALELSGADTVVAITGIAGPGGGSEKKPVGTVVFARAEKGADPAQVVADQQEFGDLGRGGVRLQAALCALDLLMPSAGEPEEP